MQRWSPEVIRYLHTAADRSRYYTDLARELGAFLHPEDRVCDAGCGLGLLSRALLPYCGHVTAIDRSPAAIADLTARGHDPRLTALTGDIRDLPPQKPYDAMVFCLFSGTDEILDIAARQCGGTALVVRRDFRQHQFSSGVRMAGHTAADMEQELRRRGHELVDFEDSADAYIINTCSVTAVSDKKSRQMIRRARRRSPGAVVAAFDAATSGRLSLTYYSELPVSDLLERLHNWDALCCWEHSSFGIQSPSLSQIADCAFGTVRVSDRQTKLETDERVMRQQVQRLLSCRVDRGKMPADIARAAAAKASNLQIMDAALRETVLFTACAVLRKYKYDWYKEEWSMALEPQKKDVSYQYGRLLAVFEKLERDTYDSNEQREPNAIRMQSVFAKRPLYASRIIWEQLKKAYYPKLAPGARIKYDRIIEQIIQEISSFPQAEQEEALKDTYLFGYYLQRSALYTSGKTENSQEEE